MACAISVLARLAWAYVGVGIDMGSAVVGHCRNKLYRAVHFPSFQALSVKVNPEEQLAAHNCGKGKP